MWTKESLGSWQIYPLLNILKCGCFQPQTRAQVGSGFPRLWWGGLLLRKCLLPLWLRVGQHQLGVGCQDRRSRHFRHLRRLWRRLRERGGSHGSRRVFWWWVIQLWILTSLNLIFILKARHLKSPETKCNSRRGIHICCLANMIRNIWA